MDPAPNHRPLPDEAMQSLLQRLRPEGASHLSPLETFYRAGYAAALRAAEAERDGDGAISNRLTVRLHPSSFSSGALAGVVVTVLLMVWWVPGQQANDFAQPVDNATSPPAVQRDAPVALAAAERGPSDTDTDPLAGTEANLQESTGPTVAQAGSAEPSDSAQSLLGILGRSLLGLSSTEALTTPLQPGAALPQVRYSIIAGGLRDPLLTAVATHPSEEMRPFADGPHLSASPADEPAVMLRLRSQLADVEL